MRKTVTGVLGLLVILSAAAAPALAGELPGWVEPMRKVHAAGKGKVERGVLINIGDSITYSNAVVDNNAPSAISAAILGANPPALADLPSNESPAPADPAALPSLAWLPEAPPLPAPTGEVVKVKDVRELEAAVTKAAPGQTILLADGEYRMAQTFHISTSGLTVRGASGAPTKVVLDFAASRNTEGVAFARCTDCTLADLTVQNVKQNGIKLNSNLGVERITLYHVISHNVWQRHVKGPRVPDEDGQPDFIEGCRVQYCLFYNDRPKRMDDEPYEEAHPGQFGGNYVGGMDIMSAKGWVISDNVFIGIHGRTGSARGAVFLWHNGAGCTIERNVIMDCDSGICLGNSSARDENRRHANGVLVRNNFIVRCPEVGILADHTRDCRIVNNTVFDPDSRLGRLIRVLHASDGLVVANNLLCGPRMSVEEHTGTIDVRNNLVGESKDYFVDPAHGDLHLTAKAVGAIGHATPEKDVSEDFDRQRRGDKPDLGADQFVPPAKELEMP
jgi:hypothetical protein